MPKPKLLSKQPEYLRAPAIGRPSQVDRSGRRLLGYVVAQKGPFKSGRGEFDERGLARIVELGNAEPKGVPMRFGHESLSNDGLASRLGRATNFRLELDPQRGPLVRADAQFYKTAMQEGPKGNLGRYVMNIAKEDPDALSSSLVLQAKKEFRLDASGKKLKNEKGEDMPPLWFPTAIKGSDIVDTGDAVDGLLSAGVNVDAMPDALIRRVTQLLDRAFLGQRRDVVAARCQAWFERYLDARYGMDLEEDDFEIDDEEEDEYPLSVEPIHPEDFRRELELVQLRADARQRAA